MYHIFLPLGHSEKSRSLVTLLGVHLDDTLTFDNHINELVSSCYYHIRNIGKVKSILSQSHLETLLHSVISSKLDYCNIILYGITKSNLNKLQKLQNAAARLVYKLPRRSRTSVSDLIRKLHWLRVDEHIIFKMMTIVYKFFTSNGPAFINHLLQIDDCEKRSLKLEHFTSKYGKRSFRYAAPRFWNQLPSELRNQMCLKSFKKD